MSLADLDPVIHAPKRLAAMAVLTSSDHVTFRFLVEHLGLSESDLSKQMSALESAGYVKVHKSGRGRGSTTSYALTSAGRTAYRRYRAALHDLLGE
ncbi:transcriptional regulator [Mumia quercus]|uniref:transcriptional regulator n=1 Tax=Mumia quercus TaxID=2976125 RepID=UPI0021D1987F|nr:transcriptional regulator [Mumia quercus]